MCASVGAEAADPVVTTRFTIRDPVTFRETPALVAHLDQYVCFKIHALLVPEGEHSLQWTIYDGLGNQVSKVVTRDFAAGSSVERGFCHGYDDDHDAVGTWWYVVELDREPLISASFEVRPSSD
jgi:hypothetical protein